jgi:hypothetical protein
MKTLFAIFGLGTLGLFNSTSIATTSIPSPYPFATSTTQVRDINIKSSSTASTTKFTNQNLKKIYNFEVSKATTTKVKVEEPKPEKKVEPKIEIPKPKPVKVPVTPPTQNIEYYTNTRGNEVQSPTYYNSAPAGASAKCRDGTYSFSQSRRGTCSHHGGVSQWLN